jgi:hypothetical protein
MKNGSTVSTTFSCHWNSMENSIGTERLVFRPYSLSKYTKDVVFICWILNIFSVKTCWFLWLVPSQQLFPYLHGYMVELTVTNGGSNEIYIILVLPTHDVCSVSIYCLMRSKFVLTVEHVEQSRFCCLINMHPQKILQQCKELHIWPNNILRDLYNISATQTWCFPSCINRYLEKVHKGPILVLEILDFTKLSICVQNIM